ncbi:MAG TPA: hypothetical protein VMF65_21385, partial [Acidimicrobiales bacterium]|nr:hypothetical protein [Acidimicrobiales bacterium]
MNARKLVCAAATLVTALSLSAQAYAATTTATTPTVASAIVALESAQNALDVVLGSYTPNNANWTASYTKAEAEVVAEQAALNKAIAAATPAAPTTWHELGTGTVTGDFYDGVSVPTITAPGYYTGTFKAVVKLNTAAPSLDYTTPARPVESISWQLFCTAIYGVGTDNTSGNATLAGTRVDDNAAVMAGSVVNGSYVLPIPAHMR